MIRLLLFLLLFINGFILKAQDNVASNLFGFRTSLSFVFFDIEDTVFMNDVKSLQPNVLSFPGGFGNFYHLDGVGYGIKLDEIRKYHKKSKIKELLHYNF